MKPVVRILGQFQPSTLNRYVIERELISFIKNHGFNATPEDFTTRDPIRTAMISKSDHCNGSATPWHRDGRIGGGSIATGWEELIMWSNVLPTEFKYGRRRVLKNIPDGSVIWIHNANNNIVHRTPLRFSVKRGRWFTRITVMERSK